jgi:hypothetical protein
MSPRIKSLRPILEKLDPPAARPVPFPPLMQPGAPTMLLTKKRARRYETAVPAVKEV